MRGSLSKSTMFQGGGDRCLHRPPRRIVICVLAKQSLSYNVMRDEITIDVYFLDSHFFFFVLASRCEFAIQLLSKHTYRASKQQSLFNGRAFLFYLKRL